tara:strand:+ start:335 stop:3076 length:2742 start_codon:yes stop_codon:yes gene_type:complete
MFVTKRNGSREEVLFDKITQRIKKLIKPDEEKFINATSVGQKVVTFIHNGITTEELDVESAKICVNLCTTHPLYPELGGRILTSNLHKKTSNSYFETVKKVKQETDFYDSEYFDWIIKNGDEIDKMIEYDRDYNFDYFGFKTLERAYLIKNQKTGHVYERPQHMFMRVASFLNMGNLEMIKKTYDLLSLGMYIHASPTLFNSASKRSQLSSCFLLGTGDSIDDITDTWKSVSSISKWGGGIGLHVSNIRAKGALIRGTNGPSSGIIPMLQVYNSIARYVNQGGKRKGSIAIYLEPHHDDIFEFLDLRKNFGDENLRARDLFLALWVSDLFMKQVKENKNWYLMCPDECPGLCDVWGNEYEELYWKYVNQGKYKREIEARKLMKAIWESQQETGTPYITYKDNVNRKSNQQNIGTIRSSNLCNEIVEYSDKNEHAVCNLASIALNKMITQYDFTNKEFIVYTKNDCKYCRWTKCWLEHNKVSYQEIIFDTETVSSSQLFIKNLEEKVNEFINDKIDKITFPQIFMKKEEDTEYIGGFEDIFSKIKPSYDFNKLYDVAYIATKNLNEVIDINYYPTVETKRSNMKHRPIGLGIQGLADTLVLLRIPFDSEEALELNSKIMETIYFASMNASMDISKERSENMKKLIKITKENKIIDSIPEFYEKNYTFAECNDIYHSLKPNKYELNREIKDTNGSYSSFEGSPVSKGILQFDMWGFDEKKLNYDWKPIKNSVKRWGIRNSLLVALMPTASTSQILGNNECFEFFTSNIYTRNTLAGDFPIINKYMVNDLISIGEWNVETKDFVVAGNGSIQHLTNIPSVFKKIYQTQWELKQIWVLKAAKARGPFVDQTQSMNVFMEEPNDQKLNSCLFWGWENGLKSGLYYLRTKPSSNAIKFTIDPSLEKIISQEEECEMCSA